MFATSAVLMGCGSSMRQVKVAPATHVESHDEKVPATHVERAPATHDEKTEAGNIPIDGNVADGRISPDSVHKSNHSTASSSQARKSQPLLSYSGKATPVEVIVLSDERPASCRLTRERVLGQLNRIARSLNPSDYKHALKALNDIYRKVVQHAKDKQYYEIKLSDETFINQVWKHPACKEFMKMSGWVVKNDCIRLKDDSYAHIVSQLLESNTNAEKFPFTKQVTHHSPAALARQFSSEVEISSSDCSSDDELASTSTMFTLSKKLSNKICLAIFSGFGYQFKRILEPHSATDVKNMYVYGGRIPLISVAYITRQIGIARILVNEYSVNPNALDADGDPCFIGLFRMSDPSAVCQNLIIDFVKEFNLNVSLCDGFGSFLHYVVLHQLFTVLKYLVENCEVNINQGIIISPLKGGTVLHLAYSLNEMEIAKYLIEHGADQNIVDNNGKKPHEYSENEPNAVSLISNYFLKKSKIYKDLFSKESQYYHELLMKGINQVEAIDLTYERYPELKDEVAVDSTTLNPAAARPEMKKLFRYISDMAPSYFAIGLELVPYNKLKVIKTSNFDNKEKCEKMLQLWLQIDVDATWTKLCKALRECEEKLCTLADQILSDLEA